MSIRDDWGVTGPIDAIAGVDGRKPKYYLFKDDAYWRYHDGKLSGPWSVRREWGVDGPVNAVTGITGESNRYYLFKGDRYWRFQDERLQGPLRTSDWRIRD
jgi:hypothetical protein